ncbi:hypothetical protein [Pseudomonas costantinii]|uniref:Uncharacterized protein n=1 Tax=Pseudomonas costantinii TaxID=168469 RepID=A0A1S2UAB2_9PSED|nr:hypothetical protein [Pseudomonas costantinii]NVZ20418.1 hypothetical protein [Pseudomonas costantinii]OIN43225.1 hypothetical protein BFL40_31715 [Pseudomonas costantinii]
MMAKQWRLQRAIRAGKMFATALPQNGQAICILCIEIFAAQNFHIPTKTIRGLYTPAKALSLGH